MEAVQPPQAVAEGFHEVEEASRSAGGLREELGLGLDVLFRRANNRPSVERLVLVEVAALGPVGIERREQLISSYEAMLRENLGAAPRPGVLPRR